MSDALAESVVLPETEVPPRGAVIDTVGAVVSLLDTVGVAPELALAEPPAFVAVTVTRRELPASAVATVYEDVVAPEPEALVQLVPLERCHW